MFLKYIYSFCKKKKKKLIKIYLSKFRCDFNNLVFKVSEAANLWYSLKKLFQKTSNFLKKIYEGIYS